MDLSTSVEISEAFEEHVVRGDDLSDMGCEDVRYQGGVAIIRKHPILICCAILAYADLPLPQGGPGHPWGVWRLDSRSPQTYLTSA